MTDIIQEMQRMGERMVKLRDLFGKRDALVSQLSDIDNEIKAILDVDSNSNVKRTKGKYSFPNKGTDPYLLTEVMSDKPMHKDEILKSMKKKGHDLNPGCLASALSNYKCFQSKGRGYWVYIKPNSESQ